MQRTTCAKCGMPLRYVWETGAEKTEQYCPCCQIFLGFASRLTAPQSMLGEGVIDDWRRKQADEPMVLTFLKAELWPEVDWGACTWPTRVLEEVERWNAKIVAT